VGQRFRASQHLRHRTEFQAVYDRGVKASGRFMTIFVLPRERRDLVSRLGIAATRKMGAAVERNRAKRRVREIFRQHPAPPGLDIVVIPRRALIDAPFSSLEAEYVATIDRRVRQLRPAP
jgi:ribonuclease P protein component